MYERLPGGEILKPGLEDLRAGVRSINALLVLIAAPRLTRCGIPVPRLEPHSALPEHDLYQALSVEHGPEAYRFYRSLMRRLVSLEQALESQMTR